MTFPSNTVFLNLLNYIGSTPPLDGYTILNDNFTILKTSTAEDAAVGLTATTYVDNTTGRVIGAFDGPLTSPALGLFGVEGHTAAT